MIDPKLLAQARQGEVAAIAELLNRSLQPRGIWARVETISEGLVIALESSPVPPNQSIQQRVCLGLSKLQPQGIAHVTLQGFALGEVEPAWTHQIGLTNPANQHAPERSPIRSTYLPAKDISPLPGSDNFPPAASLAPPGTKSAQRSTLRSRSNRLNRRRSASPFVLKWSDFDPAMLAIIGFIAVYGFMGARDPSYDGPFIWLHYPDLAIHETGHLLFMPFGHFLMVLGGSLTQIAFPSIFTGYFYFTKQYFSSALTLFWTGQNFMDVAVYMADAPYRALPLTHPNIDAHDWWQLFNLMNCMGQAELLAGITHWIGVLIYVASVITGVYFAYDHRQMIDERHQRRKEQLEG